MAVITISRQFGAGGRTLGNMIAQKLNYRFLDDQIIQEIAKHAKVTKNTVISMERTAGGAISRIISSFISRDYMTRLLGEDIGYLNEEVYLEVLDDVMHKLAAEDNVILTGRGGQFILKNVDGVFHILLVANLQDRLEFMKKHYKLSDAKAEAAVAAGEKRRSALYRKMGKSDYNDPIHFHMVLNMSDLSLEKGMDLVCNLVGS